MPDAAWKREERIVADIFGGVRIPVLGDSGMDVDAPGFAISCKKRKKGIPEWLRDAVEQIEKAARPEQLPIVVLTDVRQGRAAKRYVLLDLETFRRWYV